MKNPALSVYLMIILGLSLPASSLSQERTIKGRVTAFDEIPIIGAEVKVKSSRVSTWTDSTGHFELSCQEDDKIKVKAKGFIPRKVRLNEKTRLVLVDLDMSQGPRSKKLAVGYGHVQDADKLHAISSLHSDEDDFSGYSNMYDLIEGRLPGVQVVGKDIIIRGTNSLNYSSAALIVVDGTVQDNSALDLLFPAQVKSVSVLKDGATSIYGNRGASGVILIETKRGGD